MMLQKCSALLCNAMQRRVQLQKCIVHLCKTARCLVLMQKCVVHLRCTVRCVVLLQKPLLLEAQQTHQGMGKYQEKKQGRATTASVTAKGGSKGISNYMILFMTAEKLLSFCRCNVAGYLL